MSAGLHPRLAGPPPRDAEYCVDCYADGGRVTVATRKFGDDALCERHYQNLCKEMGVEPEVITLSEVNAAKEMGAKETPIKKIRKAPTPRPEAGLKPAGHPGIESVAMRVHSDVLRLESTEARGGTQSAAVTTFPSDSELAEAAHTAPAATARLQDRSTGDSVSPRSIPDAGIHKTRSSRSVSSGSPAGVLTRAVGMPNCGSRQNGITSEHRNQARHAGETAAKASDHPITRSPDHPISSSPQRPDSTVAPAAEDAADRAHIPTQPLPSPATRSSSAVNLNPSKPERSTSMRSATALRNDQGQRVCSCGCGTPLRGRHPYIKGHNTASFQAAAKEHRAKRGRPRANGADGGTDARPRVSTLTPSILPPVALANGNGHGKIASDGAYIVPCDVSEWAMDNIWVRLQPEEKAQLLFGQGWRKPQTGEAARAGE